MTEVKHRTYSSLESDAEYLGELKDGKKHGHGTLIFNDGTKYVGEFKDDVIHGHGTLTYADGDVYVGGFSEDTEHGHCTFCLLYTSPSPRDRQKSRMPSSA